jgi:hypothetical protein
VVISDGPQFFGQLREKLSVVTHAWFMQRDFTDMEILKEFQASIAKTFKEQDGLRDQYFGLSLRELIHEYKHQTLILFKCALLQPKVRKKQWAPGRILLTQFRRCSSLDRIVNGSV